MDVLSLLLDAHDEEGDDAQRPADPRRGHDAALRRSRHDDLDGRVHVLRARAPPGGRAPLVAEQDAVLGPTSAPAHAGRPHGRAAAAARDGARRDPPHVPARLDRPAPLGGAVRVRRPHRPGARLRQLLLLGEPPPARRLSRTRRLPARALRARAKAALPKGAYVPFGGGSRTCIGMRFGQLEIRAIATLILCRFTLELPDEFHLRIRQMPTISPAAGCR